MTTSQPKYAWDGFLGTTNYSGAEAIVPFGKVCVELITCIPGDPWKSTKAVIDALRKAQMPTLLKDN